MAIIAQIKQIQGWSNAAWEQAVDTAGPEYAGGSEGKAAQMQALADECDSEYDAAIETLEGQYANWQSDAKSHLEQARSLESEGGDGSHADMALEALAEYIAEETAKETADEAKREISARVADLRFVTPPENGGQIVEVSYACDADNIYERIHDRSDRTTVINVYEHPNAECDFDPQNGTPRTGEHLARIEM